MSTDTDKKHQADCDRRIVDVIVDHCEATGLRAGAASVREMAAETLKLRADVAALLRYCRQLDPGATDEEILAAAGCEIPDDAVPAIEEI